MKCNIGKPDKTIRLLLALLIGATGIYLKSWWALAALVPLVTGLASFCPIYKILGFNTCQTKGV